MKNYLRAFFALRPRTVRSRMALRRRMFFGVTSTSSSLLMYSMACSSDRMRGGVRRMASSEDDVRMFETFFFLHGLMSMSFSREFSPTIMPS